MLSRAKITVGRAGYYTEVVARGLDDYLSGAGEAPGRWCGAGASVEGVRGEVTAEQMAALFESADACHPVTGAPLGAGYRVGDGRDKVTGWDLTVSAPKSFSTLWAVADLPIRNLLDDCHSAAVDATIGYLEEHGAYSRVGRGGRFQVDTAGLLIARFDHRTSRAGDPQRHSHLLLSNRVRCVDGHWRSLDSRALHGQLKAAGVVYQAALRAETTSRVGVLWDLADTNGQADIVDVPAELRNRWSTRRRDVLHRGLERIAASERVVGRELTMGERRREFETATLETRPAKTAMSGDAHERWRTEAAAAGHSQEDWMAKAINNPVPARVDLAGLAGLALEDLADNRSTWRRADLVVATAALLPPQLASTAEATRELIDHLVDDALADPEVIDLTGAAGEPSWAMRVRRDGMPVDRVHDRARYSTATTVAKETEVLDFATQRGQERAVVDPNRIEQTLTDTTLSEDQQATVRHICTDGAALSCVVGPAGTGKTTTMSAASRAWTDSGYRVRGFAVSAVAAEVLRGEVGIQADTVAKLLHENRRPDVAQRWLLRANDVVIVDEASMLASEQFVQLTRLAAAAHAKLVAVGDYRQLGAVQAGGLFKLLARETRTAELSAVWRFRNSWERAASLQLRDRHPDVARVYEQAGRLHHGVGDSTWDAMVHRWKNLADNGSVVMLANRRGDAANLAAIARAHRVAQGIVESTGIDVDGQSIGVGDDVVTLRNDRRLITNTGAWVRNGDRWTVTARTHDGALDLTHPERGNIRLPAAYVTEHVALGYALTVHKAQGLTVDHGLLYVDDATSAQALYVGMTRGRGTNEAFVRTEHQSEDHVTVFAAAAQRDTAEVSALELLRDGLGDHANRSAGIGSIRSELDRVSMTSPSRVDVELDVDDEVDLGL